MHSRKIPEKLLAECWKHCLIVCKRFKVEYLFKKPILIKLFLWTQRIHSWQLWPKTFGKKPKNFFSLIAYHKWHLILSFGKKHLFLKKFLWIRRLVLKRPPGCHQTKGRKIFQPSPGKMKTVYVFLEAIFLRSLIWTLRVYIWQPAEKIQSGCKIFPISKCFSGYWKCDNPTKNFWKEPKNFSLIVRKRSKIDFFPEKVCCSVNCSSGRVEGSSENLAEKLSRSRISCHHTHNL